MPPETRYARNGSATIAWSAGPDAPVDLVFVPGFISHVEHAWEEPSLAAFFERLSGFARLILMDRRGTGLSDRLEGPLSLDDEAEDLGAVLDAAGSERAVLLGYTSGAALAITFAAQHPERVRALVLYAPIARAFADVDYDWTWDEQERERAFAEIIDSWGSGANLDDLAPSRAGDPRMRAWLGRLERLSSSPGAMRTLFANIGAQDVRGILAELRVPTLILHRSGDRLIDVRHSRYLAGRIPGARYVELDGEDNFPSAGDTVPVLGEIEEFLTGGRSATIERGLLTILLTDIAGSTQHAARLGDAAWRDLLASHDAAIRREIDRFGGREVKTIGDAFLIAFEGAPSRALRCALAIKAAVRELGLDLRTALHTGECELIGDDIGGMAVHIAARVNDLAKPGEILVSGTAYGTVVGSGIEFASRGSHELKGIPGPWPIFSVLG
ncbi:MAG TPA: alpha/beta fold hydrolase [Solirubrobacteraceae bacterium]|nr:alpha/beta fold hydrolase [Solirubrobacteraceae bacterium]